MNLQQNSINVEQQGLKFERIISTVPGKNKNLFKRQFMGGPPGMGPMGSGPMGGVGPVQPMGGGFMNDGVGKGMRDGEHDPLGANNQPGMNGMRNPYTGSYFNEAGKNNVSSSFLVFGILTLVVNGVLGLV